ncbi:MAG: hypothetical protein AAFW60_08060 [Pseudomonadota bacterium]
MRRQGGVRRNQSATEWPLPVAWAGYLDRGELGQGQCRADWIIVKLVQRRRGIESWYRLTQANEIHDRLQSPRGRQHRIIAGSGC